MSGPAPHEDEEQLAAALALAFAQLFVEVEAGRRPRAVVEPLTTPRVAARLAPYWVRGGPPRRVLRVQGQLLAPGRFEAVVLLSDGRRTGALALRLERFGRRWRVTDLSRPEDGVLPEPVVWLPLREPCAFDLVCGGDLSGRTGVPLAPVVGL